MSSIRGRVALSMLGCLGAFACAAPIAAQPPNILVIVLDDIGIDQAGFAPFGWDETELAPDLPVLEAIAAAGVSFTNFWATPECSPTRAALLTGRLGYRTGVVTAIIDPMLPSNQLNPAEVTLPKLLGQVGYRSAMIGKYHMGGGPTNTPPGYGYEAPATTAGLDFYDGYWELPPSIDKTLGGQSPDGPWTCGGPGGAGAVGAACFPDGTCLEGLPAFEAMAMGGTPLLDASGELARSCAEGDCAAIDFTLTNAYYAWPRYVVDARGNYEISPEPQREYLTSFITRRAEEWIGAPRRGKAPWLAFVTHSASHTPIQPPPPSLSEPGPEEPDCTLGSLVGDYRVQFKRMSEAVDRSVGEMLVDLGLATEEGGAFELVDPRRTNTLIVVFGDNGSLGSTVLPPFAPAYAKQTVYQTGVWTPCIVAGPMVVEPGRVVDEMVNVVDLFSLIAETAGVDLQAAIPPYRTLDAAPMMPYLTDVAAPPQREFIHAVYRNGDFPAGQVGPCIIGGFVVDGLTTTPGLCTDNGGCWLGGAQRPPYPVQDYCDLLAMGVFECDGTTWCASPTNPLCDPGRPTCDGGQCAVAPTVSQYAVRSGEWKLVVLQLPTCLAPNDCVLEFYRMSPPVPPHAPGLDTPGSDAQLALDRLTPEEEAIFESLRAELFATLAEEWYCPGDGNKDRRVDASDLAGLLESWGSQGFWDINEDGTTDGADLGLLLGNWNPDCTGQVNPAGQRIPACLYD